MFTEMQKQLSEVNAKCDCVVDKLRLLETRVPERPPYQVPPEQQRPASSSQAAPMTISIAEHLTPAQLEIVVRPSTTPTPEMLIQQAMNMMAQRGPLREALGHIPELGKFFCKSFDA